MANTNLADQDTNQADEAVNETEPESSKDESSGRENERKVNQPKHKNQFLTTLEKYENQQTGLEKLRKAMSRHFKNASLDDRQELVVLLFSSDPAIRAIASANFARLERFNHQVTPFDEAAREKSLVMARLNLKKEEFSHITAPQWLTTLSLLGKAEDIPLLSASCRKIIEGELKGSVRLHRAALKSIEGMINRFPEELTPDIIKDTAIVMINSFDSRSGEIQDKAVNLFFRFSSMESFSEIFLPLLSGLPRTDRTAGSLGLLSKNLHDDEPDRVLLVSRVLEKSLQGADDQFLTNVIKEVLLPFQEEIPRQSLPTLANILRVIEPHFESFLSNRKEINNFREMDDKEKLARIISFFPA